MFSNTGSVVDSTAVSKEVFKVQALEVSGAEVLEWAGSFSWFWDTKLKVWRFQGQPPKIL